MFDRKSFFLFAFLGQVGSLSTLPFSRRARSGVFGAPKGLPANPGAEFGFSRAIEAYETVIDAMLAPVEPGRD
jgi:hypothetical protein